MGHELTPLCLQGSPTKSHVAPLSRSVFCPLYLALNKMFIFMATSTIIVPPENCANYFTLIQVAPHFLPAARSRSKEFGPVYLKPSCLLLE